MSSRHAYRRAWHTAWITACALSVGACTDDASEPGVQRAARRAPVQTHHLFSSIGRWHVREAGRQVLAPGALDTLRRSAEDERQAEILVWIHDEPIGNFWGLARAGVDGCHLWQFRPRFPLTAVGAGTAIPEAQLSHDGRIIEQSPNEPLTQNTCRITEDGVRLATATSDVPPGNWKLTYPTRLREVTPHLVELLSPCGAQPTVREKRFALDCRPAVFLPPPFSMERELVLSGPQTLHFACGLDGQAWAGSPRGLSSEPSRSDGVLFELAIRDDAGAEERLWHRFVRPEEAGQFVDVALDLPDRQAWKCTLIVRTHGSPDATTSGRTALHDFAYFTEPYLAPSVHEPRPRNVLLVLIDTLRPDALRCYSSSGVETPTIDRLVAEGTLFENARSSCSWTLPAHASLFTSLFPTQHGVHSVAERMGTHLPTLAGVLRAEGWRTAAFTEGQYVSPTFGLAHGFDRFQQTGIGIEGDPARVLRWVDQSDAPFFVFFHTLQVHTPYDPPEPYRTQLAGGYRGNLPPKLGWQELARFRDSLHGEAPREDDLAYIRNLYHAEIAYTDLVLGELLDGLRARGILDETLVIVTSDHGEELFDHGNFGHGGTLYEEQLRIPLIARLPGVFEPSGRITTPVRLVDIAPTVLDVLDRPVPLVWVGTTLLDQETERSDFAVLQDQHESHPRQKFLTYACVLGMRKWILVPEGDPRPWAESAFFDLRADPRERHNAWTTEAAAEMKVLLDRFLQRHPCLSPFALETPVLGGPEIRGLEALGYLGQGGKSSRRP
ncbi:MAG: sulfatase [Planctomycetes bacterium]|nr:sulfatase [Planctomycetota bacterium]